MRLILPIKKEWLDMILSGEKCEEYREMKEYWTVRIIHWLGFHGGETETVLELLKSQRTIKAKSVVLQNGYGCKARQVEVMCTLSVGTGKEEWGAEPDKEYYRFHIQSILREE